MQYYFLDKLNNKPGTIISIMSVSVIMNLFITVFIAWNILPFSLFTLRFAAGFFLLVFVCLHGWFRYGLYKMTVFFAISLCITWLSESLSIETGFPFGNFHYTDLLGVKIGAIPLLIIPAYFFNGYLAWTISNLIIDKHSTGISRKNFLSIPLLASLLMVIWNLSFDPIMSTIEGNWIWHDSGFYFGVPVSNFLGWLLTVYLVFQIYSLFLLRMGDRIRIKLPPANWYLFPAMYLVQGLPALLYPLLRQDFPQIYRPVAVITLLTLFPVVILCIIMISKRTDQELNDGI